MRKRFLSLLAITIFSCFGLFSVSCSSPSGSVDRNVSIVDFEKTEEGFCRKVDNSTETFSFIDKVKVPSNCSWNLYSDFDCRNEILSKTISCQLGNNKIYMIVNSSRETIGFYSIEIYRLYMYTVSFNTSGGTYIPDQLVQEESYVSNVDDPTRSGYTFTGWDYDFSQKVLSNLRINALWSAHIISVTLDPNGGTVDGNTQFSLSFGSTYSLPTPNYTGKDFLGWFYNGSLINNNGKWSIDNDCTLIANWKTSQYTITYDCDGGTMSHSTIEEIDYGSTIVLPSPEKTGYSFLGWFLNGTKFESETYEFENNIVLVAHWNANVYEITFDVNGGDPLQTSTFNYTYDSNVEVPTPSRTGYEFSGWYYQEEQVTNGKWKIADNATIIARWSPLSFSVSLNGYSTLQSIDITYVYNDGTDYSEVVSVKPYDVIPYKIIRRDGYYLGGWTTTVNDLNTLVSFENTKTNKTVYAYWVEYTQFANELAFENTHYSLTGKTKFSIVAPVTTHPMTVCIKTYDQDCRFITKEATLTVKANSSNAKAHIYNVKAGEVCSITVESDSSTFEFDMYCTCNEFTRTFTPSGFKTVNVVYDSAFDLGIATSSDGLTFNGWYTEINGGGTQLTDQNGLSVNPYSFVSNITAYPYFS